MANVAVNPERAFSRAIGLNGLLNSDAPLLDPLRWAIRKRLPTVRIFANPNAAKILAATLDSECN